MTFRADESQRNGFELALEYLTPRGADKSTRDEIREFLHDTEDKLGPAVLFYPSWHPLMTISGGKKDNYRHPNEGCGYPGEDHTVLFRDGFISCPYKGSAGAKKIITSVKKFSRHPCGNIEAEIIPSICLYNDQTEPVMVRFIWDEPLLSDGTIPVKIVMPLILEYEVPSWRTADVAEPWENMRSYFLGSPSGSRSSLFVNKESGQKIKVAWNAIIQTGMYGNIKI